MIFYNPKLYSHNLHDSYARNLYIIIEEQKPLLLVCMVENIFWKFYKQTEREFKTWEHCLEEIK